MANVLFVVQIFWKSLNCHVNQYGQRRKDNINCISNLANVILEINTKLLFVEVGCMLDRLQYNHVSSVQVFVLYCFSSQINHLHVKNSNINILFKYAKNIVAWSWFFGPLALQRRWDMTSLCMQLRKLTTTEREWGLPFYTGARQGEKLHKPKWT